MKQKNPIIPLLIFCSIITIYSIINTSDYWVWLFEIYAGLLGVAILAFTYKRFKFSTLIYVTVAVHFAVLAIAAKYTYAEMPLFNWLRDTFHLKRNYYDRVGHFLQGFVPALVAREIFIRISGIKKGKMLGYICISVSLAISAFWELLEWWIVIFFYPENGQEWLGMQGDIWDAQQDMFMALTGAMIAIFFFSKLHNKSIEKRIAEVG